MPTTRIYWLHTLSPTHTGVGRGMGYIDLPIDRDSITGWPIIRGSAFKGVWADHVRATEKNRKKDTKYGRLLRAAFGIADSESSGNNSNSGALIPTDAQLVCLPVRSFYGTFAWCTSPLCLRMLHRTLRLAGVTTLPPCPFSLADTAEAYHPPSSALTKSNKILLEDLDFDAKECNIAQEWGKVIANWVFADDSGWQTIFQQRFVILPDNQFDFLCETGTEVHTRVRIDEDTKTVKDGHLWTEESLPAETILSGIVKFDRDLVKNADNKTLQQLLEKLARKTLPLQIGGKATVGRGQVRCVFSAVDGDGK